MKSQKQYAILMEKTIWKDINGIMKTSYWWFYSAGKYSNTFSKSSSINGAKIFHTLKKAQEVLNSDKFQKRLEAANILNSKCGIPIFKPVIIEIQKNGNQYDLLHRSS